MKTEGEYVDRIKEVDHDFFAPLVFSTSGCLGQEATVIIIKENHIIVSGEVERKILRHASVNGMLSLICSFTFSYILH